MNVPLGFGRRVIAPLVPSFQSIFPEVELELAVTDKPLNLIDCGFDMAIRFGPPPSEGVIARKIISNKRYLCASPVYLEKKGQPTSLQDLHNHSCIIHKQNDDLNRTWKFIHDGITETIKVSASLSSNDGDIITEWALSGKGIVIRSEWDVKKYLESGRLKQILPSYSLPDADLFIYYPSGRNLASRARAFIDFLHERL